MNIGVLGGTFNPVHKGHIHLAETAVKLASLDKLLIIPTSKPSHKKPQDLLDFHHRINMCNLAFSHIDVAEVSHIEKGDSYSYTSVTLHRLKAEYPKDKLFLIVGSDMFLTLDSWFNINEILSLAEIKCLARHDEDIEALAIYKEKLEAIGGKAEILCDEIVDVSSTFIKEDLKAHSDRLPPKVVEYIMQNDLYGCRDYDYSEITQAVYDKAESMLGKKRFNHSKAVAKEAKKLALLYNCPSDLANLAGLAHDICKEISYEEMLELIGKSDIIWGEEVLNTNEVLHGIAGAEFLFYNMGVYNLDVLNAVRYHTIGRKAMSTLEKLIYVADLISEDRKYDDLETMRNHGYTSLDDGMKYALGYIIKDLVDRGISISKDTCEAYNYYCI